jgi:hypothetical protein
LTATRPKSVTFPEARAQRMRGADATAPHNSLKTIELYNGPARVHAAPQSWHD